MRMVVMPKKRTEVIWPWPMVRIFRWGRFSIVQYWILDDTRALRDEALCRLMDYFRRYYQAYKFEPPTVLLEPGPLIAGVSPWCSRISI